jgi:malate synthase
MEDAATAEISRAQVWQWIRHGAKLKDGRTVDKTLVTSLIADELGKIRKKLGDKYGDSKFDQAASLYQTMMTKDDFDEFLTLVAYEYV